MLSALHPLPKLAACLVWLVASIVVFDPWFQLAIIAIPALALILLERRSPLLVLGLMIPFALFGFGFLTTTVLFREEASYAVHVAKDALVRPEAVSAGVVLFLRAIACGMVSALFVLTTDPGRFVKALMVNLRLSPRVGYALFTALHLVPDLATEAQQIRLARAMKAGRPPRRVPGPFETASLLIPLLAFAIRRAGRAAVALEARGLSANRPRTVTGAPVLHCGDALFALAAAGLLSAAFFLP